MATPMTEVDDLREAEQAFERGDFASVRAITGKLTTSLDADLRKRALALRSRVSIDPVAVVIVVLCAIFFLGVVMTYAGTR